MNRLTTMLAALALAGALGGLLGGALALAAGEDAAGLSEVEKREFAQNQALPSPAEMFLAIDRLGDAEWRDTARANPRYDYGDNYARALNLGVRASDGLVAILGEDKVRLGEAINVIITLAEELMVEHAILDRSGTFETLANEGRWKELRDELESLRYLIEMEMDQLGDQDVATLVRAGGWLRGLNATAALLAGEGYPANLTSILYQPALVDYFEKELAGLDGPAREHPMVRALAEALPRLRSLVNVGYGKAVPEANIRELERLSGELVAHIEEG
jgi:hypothetical protein